MSRRLLLWVILVAGLWIVVSRFTELQHLFTTLAQGQWQWVLAAFLLQIGYYVTYAGVYRVAFSIVGVQVRLREVLPVLLASIFVNVAAPSGGTAGNALFIDDVARRGQSPARAALGTLLALLADYGVFALVLVVGLFVLFFTHNLQTYELIAAAVLGLLVALLVVVLGMGIWQPARLEHLLRWAQTHANNLGRTFVGRPLLGETWAETAAQEFGQAADAIRTRPQQLARLLLVALLAHCWDIATIYALFLAFAEPVGLGPLVAGYAMGVLFWIVSITPQGIGIVEGVMALVYTSLDVPAAAATVVALVFRGLTFWLPLLIGFFVLRRVKTFAPQEKMHAEVWTVRIAALVTAFLGLINLISAVSPALPERFFFLLEYMPIEAARGARLTSAFLGFVLLMMATHLWRRKHLAWLLAVGLLIASSVGHLLKGLDYEEASLSFASALWLWSVRHHFHARSDPPSVGNGVRVLLGATLFTLAYGALGFYLLDRHYREQYDLWSALRQTVVMFAQFYDPGLQPITGFGRYFARSIYVIGGGAMLYALFALLRPVTVRLPATAAERAKARRIVEAYGRSALARLLLLPDKSYFFTSGGSVIGYVVKGRGAIVLGDPIGPAGDVEKAIAAFQRFCVRNDWLPAYFQVLPDSLDCYRRAHLNVACIGHEALVDLTTFTLQGSDRKRLRNVLRRMARLGYQVQVHEPPLSDELLYQLRQVSDAWLSMVHGREKRFSMGWFDDEYVRSCPVLAIHTPGGDITAFANVVTEYQTSEVSIDLMRRLEDLENGAMEFLFVSLFQWAQGQGYTTFNLGMSPLAGVGEHSDDPAVERALHFIYENVNQFYNFKGLHEFKGKFAPEWSPRYLVYPGPTSLMTIALAFNRASAGDALLRDYGSDLVQSVPHLWRRWRQQGKQEA